MSAHRNETRLLAWLLCFSAEATKRAQLGCIEVFEEANRVYEQADQPQGNVYSWPRGQQPVVEHLEGAF
jgi:hypothetical protein